MFRAASGWYVPQAIPQAIPEAGVQRRRRGSVRAARAARLACGGVPRTLCGSPAGPRILAVGGRVESLVEPLVEPLSSKTAAPPQRSEAATLVVFRLVRRETAQHGSCTVMAGSLGRAACQAQHAAQ